MLPDKERKYEQNSSKKKKKKKFLKMLTKIVIMYQRQFMASVPYLKDTTQGVFYSKWIYC